MTSGERGFGIVIPTATDCPIDYSKGNRKEVLDLKVAKSELCNPEVRELICNYFLFTWAVLAVSYKPERIYIIKFESLTCRITE